MSPIFLPAKMFIWHATVIMARALSDINNLSQQQQTPALPVVAHTVAVMSVVATMAAALDKIGAKEKS
jgi:intracellular sulfur oxidation DsrE/DsrF family protein